MESELKMVEKLEESHRIAFRPKDAAEMLGISYVSLWREVKRRKIFPLATFGVFSREELIRYAREETQISRRSRNRKLTTRKS